MNKESKMHIDLD